MFVFSYRDLDVDICFGFTSPYLSSRSEALPEHSERVLDIVGKLVVPQTLDDPDALALVPFGGACAAGLKRSSSRQSLGTSSAGDGDADLDNLEELEAAYKVSTVLGRSSMLCGSHALPKPADFAIVPVVNSKMIAAAAHEDTDVDEELKSFGDRMP